ncbi:MAG: zinc-binding dehydrogenase [Elusimicrobia bacterium]|nr:zinc-binding dehydrogenase [Elusimicrobiota bacterium]
MKATLLERFGGPEHLVFSDAPDPSPAPGEILVRVRACALNHLDLWVRGGLPGYKIKFPHILGSDIAGEVAGGDVDKAAVPLKLGQRVVVIPNRSCGHCEFCLSGRVNICAQYAIIGANGGPGGYAEYVSVPAQNVFPAPRGLKHEHAASFPLTFLTAWHMLITQADVKPGQTVLVCGAGSGVGVAAIQIATMAGAKVIAASTSDKKLAAAKELGAKEFVHMPKDELHRRVLQVTDGRGVDVVFEHVGPGVFEKALKCLRPGGIVVTCGSTTGPTVELDMRYVFFKELRIQGAKMGTASEFIEVLRAFEAGRLKPVVDSVFPLSEARQAQEYLAAGRQFGKVVLKV